MRMSILTKEFEVRSNQKGLLSFLITIIPFLSLVALAGLILVHAPTAGLVIIPILALALLFHARLFVLMHDCGHGRLTKSKLLNDLIGHICALFFLVPFYAWRELHNRHHQYQGHLETRNKSFDLWTLTLSEFQSASALKKMSYRIYRHPLFLFTIAPQIFFLLVFRVLFEKMSARAIVNILALDVVLGTLAYLWINQIIPIGWLTVLAPVLILNFSMAVWMFYHQHVAEKTKWFHTTDFSIENVAVSGSVFLDLPQPLKWFSASIGYHHVHHINTKIPFYNLEAAHAKLLTTSDLTHEIKLIWSELRKNLEFHLWCDKNDCWVSFDSLQ